MILISKNKKNKKGALTHITTLRQNIVYFNRLMCFSNLAAALARAFCALTTDMVLPSRRWYTLGSNRVWQIDDFFFFFLRRFDFRVFLFFDFVDFCRAYNRRRYANKTHCSSMEIGRRTPTSGPITVGCGYKSTGRYLIYTAQPRLSLDIPITKTSLSFHDEIPFYTPMLSSVAYNYIILTITILYYIIIVWPIICQEMFRPCSIWYGLLLSTMCSPTRNNTIVILYRLRLMTILYYDHYASTYYVCKKNYHVVTYLSRERIYMLTHLIWRIAMSYIQFDESFPRFKSFLLKQH